MGSSALLIRPSTNSEAAGRSRLVSFTSKTLALIPRAIGDSVGPLDTVRDGYGSPFLFRITSNYDGLISKTDLSARQPPRPHRA